MADQKKTSANVFYRLNGDDRKLPLTSSSSDLCSIGMHSSYSASSSRDGSLGPDPGRTEGTDDLRNSIVHKWTHDQSIVCLVCSPKNGLLFCGTQDSYILILDLTTFQKLSMIKAHSGSVLCMHLAECETILFTGGSDSLVKIWNINVIHKRRSQRQVELLPTHIIYSLLDIGDIFSVAWIESTKTVLFGSQNASISFVHLGKISNDNADPSSMPSNRYDKFFDSTGRISDNSKQSLPLPGGDKDDCQSLPASRLIEVPSCNIIRYAHNGYVYAMDMISNIDAKSSLLGGTIPEEFDDVILSGGGDGIIKLWGFKDNKMTLLRSLDNSEPVLCIVTKQGDNYCTLYCGLANGTVNAWDLSTFQLVRSFEVGRGDIGCLGLCDGLLFIGTEEGVCKKPSLSDGTVVWLPSSDSCLAMSTFRMNDVSYLVSASMDNSVTLWNVNVLDRSCVKNRSDTNSVSINRMIEVLRKMVSFETVSKEPSKFLDQSRKCASFLRLLCKNLGAVKSVLLPVPDANPVVLATFQANKPNVTGKTARILWYGHYDVIEADHTDSWDTNPFEVTAVNGYLYGRGVSDNKGPLLAALYAVADLFRSNKLACDAVFLIEGEEEAGSYGFQKIVTKNKDMIGDIDWVLLSNSYWLDDNVPCLNYGLRGVVAADVEVWSDKPDRHSGVDGGVSREPTIDLINLLSKLNDDTGRVRLPNFYSTIKELADDELRLYEQITKKVKGAEISELMTKWRLPSLTVHRISVSGPGNSTVIPHAATASISIRIVPNQETSEVKKVLVDYISECFQDLRTENHMKIGMTHEAEPWLADTKNVAYQILYKNLQEAWGVEPIFIREGGSIPSIRFLEKTFNCEAAHIPTGQASDNAHLSNERLRITNLYKTKEVLEKTFNRLPCKN
ncbi:DEKNAAC100814 [Brettanomyces naardenensis]|uniref:DEKNAAC100814 n=1 Tax=Brettanomyces naardenensis TaxID=13370 RepID=A0A448YFP0_BRENA|nr:DEKNAAC100814 [Brettanomyces naardenensis]